MLCTRKGICGKYREAVLCRKRMEAGGRRLLVLWKYCSASANTMVVSITGPEDEDMETFNVVVVQECTPVLYNEAGEPYADWALSLDTAGKEAAQ